jgi:cyanophycinase
MGYLLLEGGAEFGGHMEMPDRRAMELAGGPDAPISIIPAAAAPDNNHERAGRNGVHWFKSLGATNVTAVPLIDRASADDPTVVRALDRARLIFMLGGFPRHLRESLFQSDAWAAMLIAHREGAVIGGSSAGAMVLCDSFYDPRSNKVIKGLELLRGACILPHHNAFGKTWATRLTQLLPEAILVGIDEETGMLDDGPNGGWQIYGKGGVTLYYPHGQVRYESGQPFSLNT